MCAVRADVGCGLVEHHIGAWRKVYGPGIRTWHRHAWHTDGHMAKAAENERVHSVVTNVYTGVSSSWWIGELDVLLNMRCVCTLKMKQCADAWDVSVLRSSQRMVERVGARHENIDCQLLAYKPATPACMPPADAAV
jgi:hypothetical protein